MGGPQPQTKDGFTPNPGVSAPPFGRNLIPFWGDLSPAFGRRPPPHIGVGSPHILGWSQPPFWGGLSPRRRRCPAPRPPAPRCSPSPTPPGWAGSPGGAQERGLRGSRGASEGSGGEFGEGSHPVEHRGGGGPDVAGGGRGDATAGPGHGVVGPKLPDARPVRVVVHPAAGKLPGKRGSGIPGSGAREQRRSPLPKFRG